MSPFFKVLEADGVHLTALSGHHFVHHLFDTSIAVIKFVSKSEAEKAAETREVSVAIDSRLCVLESQFTAFQSCSDLEYASQQEMNDWQENLATEKFFIISGLAPAPAKLSGGG